MGILKNLQGKTGGNKMYLIITEFGEFWTSEKIIGSSLQTVFELGDAIY